MDKAAISKAKLRLQKAQESLEKVQKSEDRSQFELAWSDLLLAGNAIHSLLEQGAKVNPQSRQWFGGKKTERRKDKLLSYMHQARNADEHGLKPITDHTPGAISFRRTSGPLKINSGTIEINSDGPARFNLEIDNSDPTAGDLVVTTTPQRVELIAVTDDRYGDQFDPPTEHLSIPLADQSPAGVGAVWVDYLEKLIAGAEQLN